MDILKEAIESIRIEVGLMVLYAKEWLSGGFKS